MTSQRSGDLCKPSLGFNSFYQTFGAAEFAQLVKGFLALQAKLPEFYPKNLHKHTCNPSAGKVEAGIFLLSQASLLDQWASESLSKEEEEKEAEVGYV